MVDSKYMAIAVRTIDMEARFELYADLFEIETDAMVAIARQRFSESIK